MKKKIYIFTPIFLSIVLLVSAAAPVIDMSENISTKVFRLHILANSDKPGDQELKLKVRDEILLLSKEVFENCRDVEDAIMAAKNNLESFKKTAEKTIKENGYNYTVTLETQKEYFNTRHYEGFSLPAGIYDCLKIEIGEGKGKNWWCVMFPSVCISGCTADFDEVLSDEEKEFIESDKYIVRFKAVEIYESIKNKIIES